MPYDQAELTGHIRDVALMDVAPAGRAAGEGQMRGWYGRGAKRGVDLGLATLALPLLLPLLAVLAVMVRADGGRAFYGHRRVGRNGRRFTCWKLRSMVVDADAALQRHLAADPLAAAEWRRDFKLAQDPRVTRLGRFLRVTSLDELPQLWNVLRGEMSFVGPRPVTETEMERYSGQEWCYLPLRPGITGLWQVSGRNGVDYATRVRMDAAYARRVTLAGDLSIILRTAQAVVLRTGR